MWCDQEANNVNKDFEMKLFECFATLPNSPVIHSDVFLHIVGPT